MPGHTAIVDYAESGYDALSGAADIALDAAGIAYDTIGNAYDSVTSPAETAADAIGDAIGDAANTAKAAAGKAADVAISGLNAVGEVAGAFGEYNRILANTALVGGLGAVGLYAFEPNTRKVVNRAVGKVAKFVLSLF